MRELKSFTDSTDQPPLLKALAKSGASACYEASAASCREAGL